MKPTIIVAVLALVLAGNAYGTSFSKRTLSDAHVGTAKAELQAQIAYSKQVEDFFRHHRWMVAPRHRTCWAHVPWAKTCNRSRLALHAHQWLVQLAEERLHKLYPELFRPSIPASIVSAFRCIHHYEGAWNDNTGNGYYGGLQMDWAFQNLYGPEYVRQWGTADNWPVWAQMNAAYRAYSSGRGFGPWPNTARACGLL